jgi:hypothetical protein
VRDSVRGRVRAQQQGGVQRGLRHQVRGPVPHPGGPQAPPAPRRRLRRPAGQSSRLCRRRRRSRLRSRQPRLSRLLRPRQPRLPRLLRPRQPRLPRLLPPRQPQLSAGQQVPPGAPAGVPPSSRPEVHQGRPASVPPVTAPGRADRGPGCLHGRAQDPVPGRAPHRRQEEVRPGAGQAVPLGPEDLQPAGAEGGVQGRAEERVLAGAAAGDEAGAPGGGQPEVHHCPRAGVQRHPGE